MGAVTENCSIEVGEGIEILNEKKGMLAAPKIVTTIDNFILNLSQISYNLTDPCST